MGCQVSVEILIFIDDTVDMDELKKMLVAMANAQSAFRAEMLLKFKKVEERFDSLDKKLSGRIDSVEKNLSDRIDKIGLQVARLEDDTPTTAEHDALAKRVGRIEKKISRTH